MDANERVVKHKLEEKYGEEFNIISHEYNNILGYYQFRACPINNTDIVFVGDYQEGVNGFKDQYISRYLSHQYSTQLKDKLEKTTTPVHVYARLSHSDFVSGTETVNVGDLKIPLLIDNATELGCSMAVLFFEELNSDNKEKLLAEIETLIRAYGTRTAADLSINAFFFQNEFLKEKGLNNLRQDIFKTIAPSFDQQEKTHIKQRLHIMLDSRKSLNLPDINGLFSLTKDVTPDKFRIYPVNLNEE